jgi:hypothetical protein
MTYVKRVLIAFDQLINALLAGYPDESVSARAYRCRTSLFWWWVMRSTDFLFGVDHCKQSYEAEVVDKHLPREYRRG